MDQGPLHQTIIEAFGHMPAQMQAAARFVLDRPHDVALLSMREQARRAGVPPATMTRLAKHLGLDGYEGLREIYAEAVRGGEIGFAGKAGAQLASQKLKGDRALAADMLQSLASQISRLATPEALDQFAAAAKALAEARRVYCLGLRSCHPVAWHLNYIMTLIGERSVLLDGMAGTGPDAIASAAAGDVLVAVSVAPYARATIELARYGAERGLTLVAVTDSEVSPIAAMAAHRILVGTESPSFFHAITPAFVVAEVLAALVAGRGGEEALARLGATDRHLAALQTHLRPRAPKR
jgi:DNA-binding MurR/RpiR family transcriptional regulator